MRNTKKFGKVKTKEEYLMLCRLEKQVKPKKRPLRYSREVPCIGKKVKYDKQEFY